ncbi:MAG: response regulator [Lachnospiraceae bacterium]|nr:response regulator [Lachnospiraceae bacterium]
MTKETKPQLLVADDMEINRIMLESLLMSYGADVELACGGNECIEKCSEKKYDLIFLDNHMPDRDGYETLKKLKESADGYNKDTPVICYTAYEPQEGREDYEKAGFDAVLNKPIEPSQLSELMVSLLSDNFKLNFKEETDEDKTKRINKEKEILPTWIFDINGLDAEDGLLHCGNANDYINALTIFATSIDEKSKDIEELLGDDNIQMYTLRVHSLKSMARLVGANELSQLAARLEAAGKKGDMTTVGENTDELLKLYKSFKEPLAQLVEEVLISNDEKEKLLPPVSDKTLNDAYMSMAEFTYCYDSGSIKMVLDALKDYHLKEEDAAKVNAIRKALKKLDWEELRNIFRL